MEFFEHPLLEELSTILSKVAVGSSFISGKINAFHSNKFSIRKQGKKGGVPNPSAPPPPVVMGGSDGIHGSYLQGQFIKIETESLPSPPNPLPTTEKPPLTKIRSSSFSMSRPLPVLTSETSTESYFLFPKKPTRRRTSSLGDLNEPSSRALFLNLIFTLNETFPDYDFQHVKYAQFSEGDLSSVMKLINTSLAELTLRYPDFLEQLWSLVDEIINLKTCEVFLYRPELSDDMDFSYLWSFHIFFFNKSLYRIVYFTCHAKSLMRAAKDAEMIDSDSDMDYEDEEEEDEEMEGNGLLNTSYEEEEEAYDMDGLLDADEMEAENEEGW